MVVVTSTHPKDLYLQRLSDSVSRLHRAVQHQDDREVIRLLRRLKALRLSCCPSVLGELSLAVLPKVPGREKLYENAASIGLWNEDTIDDDAMEDDGMSELAPSANPERTEDVNMDEESTAGGEKDNKSSDENPDAAAAKDPLTVESLVNRIMGPKALKEAVPYIQLWLAVLSIFLTVDTVLKARAAGLPTTQFQWALDLGVDAAVDCQRYVQATSRRSTDSLDAKAYFAMARIYNLAGRCPELRPYLLDEYRSATIDQKHMCQATLINQLVASYIDHNEHDLAVKFVQRASFPDDIRSTAQIVRNLFNLGRMQAVRLEYSDAHEKLVTAVRKLPPHETFARGFKLLATKHAIVVELLMGDVPEVTIFHQKGMEGQLNAYEGIVQAVRHGDLNAFGKVLAEYQDDFVQDGTLFLVERLHHSVIKAGLRRINNAYSRITLTDIAAKLGIASAADAEAIVAKAIVDGVVNGSIDPETKCLISRESAEQYKTTEPAEVFHKRISFCSMMYKSAVEACI